MAPLRRASTWIGVTVSDTFDMNLTIALALVPGIMLLFGLALPKSSIAFWELAGWVALVETIFLFSFRYFARRKSLPDGKSQVEQDDKGSSKK